MKQVLSLLLAFVFLQVETWAAGGGPVYPQNAASLSGTYAGTLVGQVSYDATGTAVATGATGSLSSTQSANGAGLFVVGQPTAGLATGVFAFFASGSAYVGTAIALVDPNALVMTGVFDGQENVTSTATIIDPLTGLSTTSTVSTVAGLIAITFQANIIQNTVTAVGGSTGTELTGTGLATYTNPNAQTAAGVPITPPPVIGSTTILIDGFLQSNTVTNTVNLSALTNTGGAAGSTGGSSSGGG